MFINSGIFCSLLYKLDNQYMKKNIVKINLFNDSKKLDKVVKSSFSVWVQKRLFLHLRSKI